MGFVMNALWLPSRRLRAAVVVALFAMHGMATRAGYAADLTWNNGAATGQWNTTDANWTGSVWSNSTPDNAVFTNLNGTITLTEAITAGSVTFNAGGVPSGTHELTLTGSNLSLGSVLAWGGYNPAGGGGGVDDIEQAYGQRFTFNNLTANASGNMTARRGMLYFLNATVNTGGTINSGDAWSVFRADNSTVTATGGIDLSTIACQVELYNGTVTTPFIKVGNAAFAGQGGLALGSGVTLVPTGDSADYIAVYNNGDVNSRAAAGLTNGGLTIDTAYAVTIATQLNDAGGAGSLTKTGTGTLTLTAVNGYTGGTTVNAGKLVLDASGGNGRIQGALTVNANATVETTGDGTGLGFSARPSSVTINGGMVTSAGTIHVWDMAGGITMTGGTLQSNNGVSAQDGTQLEWWRTSLTTLASADTATIGGRIRIRGDGGYTGIDFTVADGAAATDLLVSAAITAAEGGLGITKNGAGTMTFTGANSYTGGTTINAGTLKLDLGSRTGNTSLGSFAVASGATLNFDNTADIGTYYPGSVVLSGSGLITKTNTGSVELWTGSSLTGFTGTMDVQQGAFRVNNLGANADMGQATLNIAANATFDVRYISTLVIDKLTGSGILDQSYAAAGSSVTVGSSNGSSTFAGVIQNSSGLAMPVTKTGTGTLTLAGANTYTGATSVDAGVLLVNGSLGDTAVSVASGATLGGSGSIAGSVSVFGTLSPGNSPGVITLGSLVLDGTSTTLIEIGGTTRDTQYDGVDITTSSGLTYGGLLSFDFTTLASALPTTTLDIFDFNGSASGDFTSVTSTGFYSGTWDSLGGGVFKLDSGSQTLTFSQATGDIVVVPEPGSVLLAAVGIGIAAASRRRRLARSLLA